MPCVNPANVYCTLNIRNKKGHPTVAFSDAFFTAQQCIRHYQAWKALTYAARGTAVWRIIAALQKMHFAPIGFLLLMSKID